MNNHYWDEVFPKCCVSYYKPLLIRICNRFPASISWNIPETGPDSWFCSPRGHAIMLRKTIRWICTRYTTANKFSVPFLQSVEGQLKITALPDRLVLEGVREPVAEPVA